MAAKDGGDGLMPASELRALLKKAKRRPMSCVIALTKDKQGVILLDRRRKPRKLMGELRGQAKAAGMELDATTIRFGRASVDGASDSAQVNITVNKPVPGAMRLALLPQLRAAGMQRCTINVDEAIEAEADDGEDEPDDGDEAGDEDRGGAPGSAGGGAVPAPGAAPLAADAAGAAGSSAAAPAVVAVGAAGQGGTAPPPGSATPATAVPGGAPDTAALRARLTPLVQRVAGVVKSGQPGAEKLLAAADTAYGALKSGDLAAAGQGTDNLERLLGGVPAGTAAAGSLPAAINSPASAASLSGSSGTGQATPSSADALKGELTGLVQRIAPVIAADPSRKAPLLKLANEANALLKAGDAAGAAASVGALRQALAAPAAPSGGFPGTGQPASQAQLNADAIMQGLDGAKATKGSPDASGNWDLADSSGRLAVPARAAATTQASPAFLAPSAAAAEKAGQGMAGRVMGAAGRVAGVAAVPLASAELQGFRDVAEDERVSAALNRTGLDPSKPADAAAARAYAYMQDRAPNLPGHWDVPRDGPANIRVAEAVMRAVQTEPDLLDRAESGGNQAAADKLNGIIKGALAEPGSAAPAGPAAPFAPAGPQQATSSASPADAGISNLSGARVSTGLGTQDGSTGPVAASDAATVTGDTRVSLGNREGATASQDTRGSRRRRTASDGADERMDNGTTVRLPHSAISAADTSAGSNYRVPDVLYHYTTKLGINGIIATRMILPSLMAANPNDARYGDGQYLSDIPPGTGSSGSLSAIFLGFPFQEARFTNYVGINVQGLPVVIGRPHVYVVPSATSLDVSGRITSFGEN